MATRALIGWIESDAAGNQVLTSTYNHYDGYPENLGVGLNKFYDEPNEALKVASMGYISFLNPETGEIESKHNDPAEKTVLPDDFEEAMREIHAVADSMGADYVYLYDHDENDWMHSKMNGVSYLIKTFSMSGIDNQFNSYGDDQDLGVPGDNALGLKEGDYNTKFKNFINEGAFDIAIRIKDLMNKLKDEPKEQVKLYIDSVGRDVKRGDIAQYQEMSIDDMVEDYENYIQDKMSS